MTQMLILQTADPFRYAEMLTITGRLNASYAQRHGIPYDAYVGIKRGYHPWHAAFNRIILLSDLLRLGYRGWVFYMDADAFIADLAFDVRAYAESHNRHALIASKGADGGWWDINNGVFLLNFAHPSTAFIVEEWNKRFFDIDEQALSAGREWHSVMDDQALLHSVLCDNEQLRDALYVDTEGLINYKARFVRQIIRGNGATFEERLAIIRSEVQAVEMAFGLTGASRQDGLSADAVLWCHRILLGREPTDWSIIDWLRTQHTSLSSLTQWFLDSPEYRGQAIGNFERGSPPLSRDAIVWAYRTILGRMPEGEDVVEFHLSIHQSFDDMVRAFLESEEFQQRILQKASGR
ncbi:hypothetical protein [Azospirillum argentinense]|uniref:hypothetical protein n=1 Tax=Azospirillum argentinense TaxID=2970906 RepID=UPI0032DF1F5A